MQLPQMSPPAELIVGIALILLSLSFFYKAYQGIIYGRFLYWSGFLPFTLISPFLIHLPPGKNSLIKTKESVWVHAVVGPFFLILAVFLLGAGLEFSGLPGMQIMNYPFNAGRPGPPAIVFNKRTGYSFPVITRSSEQLSKIFSVQLGLDKSKELYESQPQTYQQTTH